jgi:hypothetical protein
VPSGHLVGALSGHLTALLPSIKIEADKRLTPAENATVDILATRGAERIIIELRRGLLLSFFRQSNMTRLARYMALANTKTAILYSPKRSPGQMEREDIEFITDGLKIIELKPKTSAAPSPSEY